MEIKPINVYRSDNLPEQLEEGDVQYNNKGEAGVWDGTQWIKESSKCCDSCTCS